MINKLSSFPDKDTLLKNLKNPEAILKVNGHFHTPNSFSAFRDIPQVFEMAKKENIKVLGINDFYSTAGYEEFHDLCVKNAVFPLFNIEFIGLNNDFQQLGIRVNDPNNPGRTYFSGKGLSYPFHLELQFMSLLEQVRNESMRQIEEMIEKVNALLSSIASDIRLSKSELVEKYAKDLVRERHLAKIIRIKAFEKYKEEAQRVDFFTRLYEGKAPSASITDESATEEEIRGKLLKAGGKAFVAEDPKAFLDVETIRQMILNAGGIPCYPVLLDDKNGNFTNFEKDKEAMHDYLVANNIYSIELIPGRNDFNILRNFVEFFDKKGFAITFGTEHNAPAMIPLEITCRGNVPLDDYLKKVNMEGACIVAAHQYLKSKNLPGYVDSTTGKADSKNKQAFITLGKAVIEHFIS